MVTQEACVNTIVSYVRENYVPDASVQIPLDQSLLEVGLLDSYAIIELITWLEAEYKVRIPDEDITKTNLGSIQKMASYVLRRREAAQVGASG